MQNLEKIIETQTNANSINENGRLVPATSADPFASPAPNVSPDQSGAALLALAQSQSLNQRSNGMIANPTDDNSLSQSKSSLNLAPEKSLQKVKDNKS